MRLLILLLLLTACSGIVHEASSIEFYPCPPYNCSELMLKAFDNDWATADCAYYDLDDPVIIEALRRTDCRLVLDEDAPDSLDAVREHGNGLMHNKFCILRNESNSLVVTGTFNPTISGQKNHNLLVVSDSPAMAGHFTGEFEELHSGVFHGGVSSSLLVNMSGDIVSVRFCPEDDCEQAVLDLIRASKKEILFFSFSLTSVPITEALIDAHDRGVDVRGVVEPFQAGNAWAVPSLVKANIPIAKANVDGLFHHKMFIFDGKVIATGSYNPTKSANERNDEALILIESEKADALRHLFYLYS